MLACKRLNEAVAEIKKMAKTDPVLAGEGVVALCERLWPALQHVDSSSGSLGGAVHRVLDGLLPLLIAAPANLKTRRKWLERMEQAILDDGVDYLVNVRQVWGKVCADETLMNECADSLLPMIQRMWTEEERHVYAHSAQTLMCLSCLLESGREEELRRCWPPRRDGIGMNSRIGPRRCAGGETLTRPLPLPKAAGLRKDMTRQRSVHFVNKRCWMLGTGRKPIPAMASTCGRGIPTSISIAPS